MRWKTLILCVQDWPTPQFGGANEETQLFPPWTLFTSLCSISWLFLYTFKSLFTTCGLLWHLIPPLVTTSNFCETKNNKVIFRDLVKHKLSCCWRPFFKGTTPYTSMSTLNFQGLISPSTIPIIMLWFFTLKNNAKSMCSPCLTISLNRYLLPSHPKSINLTMTNLTLPSNFKMLNHTHILCTSTLDGV